MASNESRLEESEMQDGENYIYVHKVNMPTFFHVLEYECILNVAVISNVGQTTRYLINK